MSEIRWRPAGMKSSAGCAAVFVQGRAVVQETERLVLGGRQHKALFRVQSQE